MTATLVTQATRFEDIAPRGTRRARLSMHLNTPRVRRWLLVQLVSIPVEYGANEDLPTYAHTEEPLTAPADNYRRLLDDYQSAALARRCM
ncbi:MAG: hypothetical protein IVW55_01175 [Chloroflexi bacterium]|nr:hypothetical protein [Chloroflexota bacterium]